MTKSELITIIHSQFLRLTQQDVDVSVKVILDSLSEALSRSDRIEVRGFGSFKLNIRPHLALHIILKQVKKCQCRKEAPSFQAYRWITWSSE